jgi:hypothetical protein
MAARANGPIVVGVLIAVLVAAMAWILWVVEGG